MRKYHIIVWALHLMACSGGSENQTSTAQPTVLDNSKEVACFLYHRFGDDRYPSTNTSLKSFKAHLSHLQSQGFQVLTLSAAIDYLRSGDKKKKTAVITIDDGFKSFYEKGLPLLREFGYPATLFINTETVGGGDYMSWDEINQAQKQGIEIGNHTHSHAFFLDRPETERYIDFENELKLAQRLIKENTGITPTLFAYPYGELDPGMKETVKKLGFKAAAAQNSGILYPTTDFMQLPRFPMSEAYSDQFPAKARMKALRVNRKDPQSFLLPTGNTQPSLELAFEAGDLQLDQLQCFIQGSKCKIEWAKNDEGVVTLSAVSLTPIGRQRRTLYTITIPDREGKWHWYSHLWINPKIKSD